MGGNMGGNNMCGSNKYQIPARRPNHENMMGCGGNNPMGTGQSNNRGCGNMFGNTGRMTTLNELLQNSNLTGSMQGSMQGSTLGSMQGSTLAPNFGNNFGNGAGVVACQTLNGCSFEYLTVSGRGGHLKVANSGSGSGICAASYLYLNGSTLSLTTNINSAALWDYINNYWCVHQTNTCLVPNGTSVGVATINPNNVSSDDPNAYNGRWAVVSVNNVPIIG